MFFGAGVELPRSPLLAFALLLDGFSHALPLLARRLAPELLLLGGSKLASGGLRALCTEALHAAAQRIALALLLLEVLLLCRRQRRLALLELGYLLGAAPGLRNLAHRSRLLELEALEAVAQELCVSLRFEALRMYLQRVGPHGVAPWRGPCARPAP